jgi:mannose-6-phosphate isomerase-like protein (cupin superfamily)
MSDFRVRRVVTGFDGDGAETFTHDGTAPNSVAGGAIGVSEVLWVDGPGLHVADDPDRDGPGFPLEPPPHGASARAIRMPGIPDGADPDTTWLRVEGDDPAAPGMHATDTLDLMVVLEGSVVMGLDDGERTLGAGDYVVQRGTRHRWRPADGEGWTYLVAMLRPGPGRRPEGEGAPLVPSTGGSPIRRVVTGVAGSPTVDGGAHQAFATEHVTMTDLWSTGGPLADAAQGGDPAGGFVLEPPPGGASFREVQLSPALPVVEESWHTTATVDVDVILSGRVRLELPGDRSTELGPGDVVVQRGTNHRWVALGVEPLRMATVMLAARP